MLPGVEVDGQRRAVRGADGHVGPLLGRRAVTARVGEAEDVVIAAKGLVVNLDETVSAFLVGGAFDDEFGNGRPRGPQRATTAMRRR